MSLVSTEAPANALLGNFHNAPVANAGAEERNAPESMGGGSWCYLFVHRSKVADATKKLKERFPIFIHRRIVYKRQKKGIRHFENATFAGLLFVQGEAVSVQQYLNSLFLGMYLAKDCSTNRVAQIPDSVMQPFMRMAETGATRIRFMPHAFSYYANGNTLVKITSGPLAGLDGYRIRIARDKCFVTTIGGLTVAIGGIYKETFENIDEYVRQRREHLARLGGCSPVVELTPLQQSVSDSFFTPQTTFDVLAIARSARPHLDRAVKAYWGKDFDTAAETALFLIEKIGGHLQASSVHFAPHELRGLFSLCREADTLLSQILSNTNVSTDLKQIVETVHESLAIRFAFLPIEMEAEQLPTA